MYHNNRKKRPTGQMVFGIRAVIEAIKSGKDIDKVLIKRDLTGDLIKELMAILKQSGTPFQKVPIERINRVSQKNHQGVLAFVSEIKYHKLDTVVPQLYEEGKTPFLLVLDGVTDVRNFGAIARSAECAGVDAIVIPDKGAAQINADAIKTSAGALHKIKVCREPDLIEAVKFIQQSGISIAAATEKTDELYYNNNFTSPIAIVMGSEEDGVSREIINMSDIRAKIPLNGDIESLNVSVAASILMYEVVRQRTTLSAYPDMNIDSTEAGAFGVIGDKK